MTVADRDGRVVATSRLVDGRPEIVGAGDLVVADRDYFRLPMFTANGYVSGAFRGRGLGTEPIAAISVPILLHGVPQGIVEGSLDLERLGTLESLQADFNEASVVILDSSGVVVHAAADTGLEVLQSLAGLPLREGLRATEGRAFHIPGAQPAIGARARTSQGWQVIAVLPQKSLLAELSQAHDVAFRWLLASVGVALLLAYALGLGIARPVQRLQEAVRNFDQTRRASAFARVRGLPDEYRGVFRHLHRLGWRLDSLHRAQAAALAEARRLGDELSCVVERRESEVRERTRELAEALSRAERASAAKGEFLARMSHEIRTPMNGMVGMLDALSATRLDGTQGEYVAIASQSAEALLGIIDDLLDFEKAQSGKLSLENVSFDLRATIHAVMSLWEPRARGLAFAERLDPALPPCVSGDPTRLAQVLGNLINNALKFTHQGCVALEAQLTARDDERVRVRFRVTDTGIGMTPEVQERLFTAFMQADGSVSRRYGGTGLGLAISQELVEMMGGRIHVTSAPGAGTTFEFELEYALAEMSAGAEFVNESTVQQLRDLRLLVVDDNEINRKVAQTLLMQCGVQAMFAEDGAQALDIVRLHELDVVLMDCHMPTLDGFRATTLIREWEVAQQRSPMRILGVSASAMDEDRRRCVAAGMNGFLAKPLRLAALRDALTKSVPGELTVLTRTLQAPVLDEAHVAEMRAASGAEFAGFVAGFAESGAELIDAIQEARELADFEALHRAAHKLKGTALALGTWRLAEECAAVDRRAAERDTTIAQSDVDALRTQFVRACEALHRAIAGDQGAATGASAA
jgi:signal transduction histidine kinase/DNA-binding NarL/FixJ family response regulator/HPt (histidine-containing phosphotransfer) domain-containing protein